MNFFAKKINLPSKIRLSIIILIACEIIIFLTIQAFIGVLFTLLLLVFSMILGIFILRKEGRFFLAQFIENSYDQQLLKRNLHQNMVQIVIGLLFIFPGFITSFLALLLWNKTIRTYIFSILSPYFIKDSQNEDPTIIDLEKEDYYEKKFEQKTINFEKDK